MRWDLSASLYMYYVSGRHWRFLMSSWAFLRIGVDGIWLDELFTVEQGHQVRRGKQTTVICCIAVTGGYHSYKIGRAIHVKLSRWD